MAASSDARTIDLFLDMLAAEQGAGDNTLNAYRSDLEDLAAFLARAKQLSIAAWIIEKMSQWRVSRARFRRRSGQIHGARACARRRAGA